MSTIEEINRYFGSNNGFAKHKNTAIELLNDTIMILDEYKIDHFLISGTLLGYIRHNDIIPWDDDIDLIIDKKILDVLPEIIQKYGDKLIFAKKGNWIIKTCYKNNRVFRLFKVDGFTTKYTFPFIDLFMFDYSIDRNSIIFFEKHWDTNEFFPRKNVSFLNVNVSIPNNPNYFLLQNYGDNYMSVYKSSNWRHKSECRPKGQLTISADEYNKVKDQLE
jgi:phosphorylcholine metabolism protein LicD